MFLLKKILTALILPPTGPELLVLFGLWLIGAITLFAKKGLEVAATTVAFSAGASSLVGELLRGGINRIRSALHEYLDRLYNRLKE